MSDWYKEEVENDGLFGAGTCEVCGKSGYHLECKKEVEKALQKLGEEDNELLLKHSITGSYGIDGPNSILTYSDACKVLSEFIGPLNASESNAIENKDWWYISHTWIGCIGYIVEKKTKKVFCLGSGLVVFEAKGKGSSHWAGIRAYLGGKVKSKIRI